MVNSQKFITMVAKMRDAQREAKDRPTRANLKICEDFEFQVDECILRNMAEQMNFMSWVKSVKTDEEPGVYNVEDETKNEEGGGA